MERRELGAPAVMIEVRRVTPDEWELLRDVRLAALADAPDAFASSVARERDFPESLWQARTATSAIATSDGEPVGLVGIVAGGDGVAELVGMWVRPDARRAGVGSALVQWVLDQAAPAPVECWVAAGNHRATRLYERCGFVFTGEDATTESDPSRRRRKLRRAGPRGER